MISSGSKARSVASLLECVVNLVKYLLFFLLSYVNNRIGNLVDRIPDLNLNLV